MWIWKTQDHINKLYSFVVNFEQLCGKAKSKLLAATGSLLASVLHERGPTERGRSSGIKTTCSSRSCCILSSIYHRSRAQYASANNRENRGRSRRGASASADAFEWNKTDSLHILISAAKCTVSSKLWNCGIPAEEFANLFWQATEVLLVDSRNVKDANVREALIQLVATPVHRFHSLISHNVTSSFAHIMERHEHVPHFVAQLCAKLRAEYSDSETYAQSYYGNWPPRGVQRCCRHESQGCIFRRTFESCAQQRS